MPDTAAAHIDRNAQALYDKLEDRVMARDQVGTGEVYYDLLRAGRPLAEMLREAVRIHAPYTTPPYHERIDDGFVNFINHDHCLLSARSTIHLARWMPAAVTGLPMAQTMWYIPTGLDAWNQRLLKAPGHYARGFEMPPGPPPAPVRHWPDQEPERLDGPLRERLGHWVDLIHRGDVLGSYRVFLGLMEDKAHRGEVLAELCFVGLIDVQDRFFLNRSYPSGHKGFRARATVELGDAIGWDDAHDVLYAGAMDIAVGPRWYSSYEMACNAVTHYLEKEKISAVPYAGTTERERAMLRNTAPLSSAEGEAFIHALIREREPAYQEHLGALLLAGKGPRQILDVIQLAAAQVLLETQIDTNFAIAQHCYEYCNTLGWFYDRFDHPQRLKLLWVAAAYVNGNAWHQRFTGDLQPERPATLPTGADRMTADRMLEHMAAAITALDGPQATAWARAYLAAGGDRGRLVGHLALVACRIGNDPHNQEIAQCLLEDYARHRGHDRDRLLLACVHHTAVHRKYGDFLECGQRFGRAFGIAALH